jgi:uncharacterized protein (TIGR02588 family)
MVWAKLTMAGAVRTELRGNRVSTSEAVLDYVPPRSGREGGLWFAGDPRAGRLTLRATGYAEP